MPNESQDCLLPIIGDMPYCWFVSKVIDRYLSIYKITVVDFKTAKKLSKRFYELARGRRKRWVYLSGWQAQREMSFDKFFSKPGGYVNCVVNGKRYWYIPRNEFSAVLITLGIIDSLEMETAA